MRSPPFSLRALDSPGALVGGLTVCTREHRCRLLIAGHDGVEDPLMTWLESDVSRRRHVEADDRRNAVAKVPGERTEEVLLEPLLSVLGHDDGAVSLAILGVADLRDEVGFLLGIAWHWRDAFQGLVLRERFRRVALAVDHVAARVGHGRADLGRLGDLSRQELVLQGHVLNLKILLRLDNCSCPGLV